MKLGINLHEQLFRPRKETGFILPTTNEQQANMGKTDYIKELTLIDAKKRPLVLKARISILDSICIKVEIFCPILIVNNTGLPLVFKQIDQKSSQSEQLKSGEVKTVSAGQFDEHEQARMVEPLLFSFPLIDSSEQASFRLGSLYQGTWCQRPMSFSADRSFWRKAKGDNMIYEFGISVKTNENGCSKTVTFSPKYTLVNKTRYRLHFAKRHTIFGLFAADPKKDSDFVRVFPDSSRIYHWNDSEDQNDDSKRSSVADLMGYENDQEHLNEPTLCLRIADDNLGVQTRWCGAFRIDSQNSATINVREELGNVFTLLRVKVEIRQAVYYTQVMEYRVVLKCHIWAPRFWGKTCRLA